MIGKNVRCFFSPSAVFLFHHCSYRHRHGVRGKTRVFPPLPQSQARFSYTPPNPSLACLLVCMPEGTMQRLCFTVFTPTGRVHAEKRMVQGEVVRRETSWRCLVACVFNDFGFITVSSFRRSKKAHEASKNAGRPSVAIVAQECLYWPKALDQGVEISIRV